MGKWFCSDSCGDIMFFDTPEEAAAAAETALDFERGEAADGWSEEVNSIFWGQVLGECQQSYCRPRTDEDYGVPSCCDEVADYEIVRIDQPPRTAREGETE